MSLATGVGTVVRATTGLLQLSRVGRRISVESEEPQVCERCACVAYAITPASGRTDDLLV